MTLGLFMIAIALGYTLGSIPVGVIVSRAYGVNILEVGSKNPGATNVKRSVGKTAGNMVFAFDALKGFLATVWPILFCAGSAHAVDAAVVGLISCILGHSFSIFLGFRGGKGVASAAGGLLALVPLVLAIGLTIWGIVFFSTRYVSLASILAGLSLPVSAYLLKVSSSPFILTLVLAAFVVIRHKSNIGRLIRGEEHRFTKNKS